MWFLGTIRMRGSFLLYIGRKIQLCATVVGGFVQKLQVIVLCNDLLFLM